MQYQRSSKLFKAAQEVIPGGVNSPVRAFKSVGGTPIFVDHAKGAYLYDVDGNRLIDYISSWGPMILGHVYEPVIDALTQRAKKGTSFGMPTALETETFGPLIIATPALSYPRYSRRERPSTIRSCTSVFPKIPIIPHILIPAVRMLLFTASENPSDCP